MRGGSVDAPPRTQLLFQPFHANQMSAPEQTIRNLLCLTYDISHLRWANAKFHAKGLARGLFGMVIPAKKSVSNAVS